MALARLRRGVMQILIRSTEALARVQVTAQANILSTILIIVAALVVAIRSIFVFVAATTIVIRTLMAHRNSREPAYFPISHLSQYQSPAGVALAH
jgi:branched-subunit amino acid transport protein AzlD